MIYFDNSATGGFKPSTSIDYAINTIKFLRVNAGHSGHALAKKTMLEVYETRKLLADFVGAKSPENVIFTSNCTEALNIALFGSLKKGDHVITTVTEHNAVLRPLYALKRNNVIDLTVVTPSKNFISPSDIKPHVRNNTKMVVVNCVSNVTGTPNDVGGIGNILKDTNIIFAVDGAQGAGHTNINMQLMNIDILCVAGHKGLYAIQGVGALIFGGKANIQPVLYGGTGVDTFNEDMPDYYPERLEAGTLNLPAILSLKGGIENLKGNLDYVKNQLLKLTEYTVEKLNSLPFIKIYSTPNTAGIVAFSHSFIPSQELSDILSDNYDIAVRSGFHCAPLMHKFLHTEKHGLLRVSFAPQNTIREINSLISALNEIPF